MYVHVAIPTNIQILHSVEKAPPIITYFKMCNNFSCYNMYYMFFLNIGLIK